MQHAWMWCLLYAEKEALNLFCIYRRSVYIERMTNLPKRRGRPANTSRANPDTRNALIRRGTALLTEQGFMSTGIEKLLAQENVPKGSFYYYFDSKEAFGYAVLDNYEDYFAKRLDRHFLNQGLTPTERIVAFVEDAKLGMAKYEFKRGCLVGNLGQEVTLLPPGFKEQLNNVLISWQKRLSTCLQAAQEHGELALDADCDELAAFFWIGWEGAVLRARLTTNTEPLTIFLRGFLAALTK